MDEFLGMSEGARIKVVGVGGAGGNAVNRMVDAGLSGVEFIAINTDAMALENNRATMRIQVGERITKGLGAGADPEVGRGAANEDRDKIHKALKGADALVIVKVDSRDQSRFGSYEEVREQLIETLLNAESRPRVRGRIFELFCEREWAVKGYRKKIEEVIQEPFYVTAKGTVKRRPS